MVTSSIDFTAELEARALDVRWIHGAPSPEQDTGPLIQVHRYDEHTVILRQSKSVHYEAPFMFLMFGERRAVLVDTGATESAELFPLRRVVDELIERWLEKHPHDAYGLLVLHTHAHSDHVAGDGQFADRARTVVVRAQLDDAWEFFGFDVDPKSVARIDLGSRVLECFASPGHHQAAVTFYDAYSGLLLTGDTVYPGRLYVDDWPAFVRTIDRMIEFTEARRITHVLGCHIEMTDQAGVDYPVGTTYQPDEPPLQMTVDDLRDIRAGLEEIGDQPRRKAYGRFIIWPE